MKAGFLFLLSFIGYNLFAQVLVNPSSTISCTQYYGTANFTVTTGTPPYNFFRSSGYAPAYSTTVSNSNPTFTVSCYTTFTVTDVNNVSIGTATHGHALFSQGRKKWLRRSGIF